MRALQIDHHGSPAEIKVTEVPRPKPGPEEVLVAIEAAAINPSDVASVEGKFPQARLPRIVGRDFAGRIVEGPKELIGAEVWGSGGDLGITRDGTHAEYLVLPQSAAVKRPSNLSAEEAAAAGVPSVTAWSALIELGRLQAGEWVVISGAAGAVGSTAVQIAAAHGAQIVALVKEAKEREHIDTQKVAAIAQSDHNDLAEVVQQATDGKGCTLALNGVGGAIFLPLLGALAPGGRMVVFSVVGGREVFLDLFAFYRRRLTIYGLDTAVLDATQCAQILRQLIPLFESGAIRPPKIAARYPLSEAAHAYEQVARGTQGKVVLLPGDPA